MIWYAILYISMARSSGTSNSQVLLRGPIWLIRGYHNLLHRRMLPPVAGLILGLDSWMEAEQELKGLKPTTAAYGPLQSFHGQCSAKSAQQKGGIIWHIGVVAAMHRSSLEVRQSASLYFD